MSGKSRKIYEAYQETLYDNYIEKFENETGIIIDENVDANIIKLKAKDQVYLDQINKINAILRDLQVKHNKARGDDWKPIKKEMDKLTDKKLDIYKQKRKVENMAFRLGIKIS